MNADERCPKCGGLGERVEVVYNYSQMTEEGDYDGNADVRWNSQTWTGRLWCPACRLEYGTVDVEAIRNFLGERIWMEIVRCLDAPR